MMLIVVVISILSLAFILDSTVFCVARVVFVSCISITMSKNDLIGCNDHEVDEIDDLSIAKASFNDLDFNLISTVITYLTHHSSHYHSLSTS